VKDIQPGLASDRLDDRGLLTPPAGESSQSGVASVVVFETDRVRIEIDRHNGSLSHLSHKALGIGLIGERRLATSFRVLLPLPHARPYAEFPNPGLGAGQPMLMHPVDSLPWCDLYNEKRCLGVYLGVHDPEPRFSSLFEQLFPNHAFPNRWPDAEELETDEPLGATLGWAHFPFIDPGGSWTSPPVVAHFHEGTWYAAADLYREWFTNRWPIHKADSWLYHEDAWQSTIISYPDDTILYRFEDLPQLARDAKECGINVIQIDGWDVGGIDRGYPVYDPDPRLGTYEDFVNAVAACQAEGVRFLLFANVQSVNTETEVFREQLHKNAVRDAYGNIVSPIGWGYHTCLGYLGHAAPKQVSMRTEGDFQEFIVDTLSHLAELGVDGLQLDKTNALSYTDYGNGGDSSVAYRRGLLAILTAGKQNGRAVNPEFALATEAWLDRPVPIVDAAYTRVFELDHVPVLEYTFPEYRLTNCLMGVDYSVANNCIRFGHIITFECDNLHGTTASRRKLAEYVAELLRLRRRLKDILWYGRIAEPHRVSVSDERVGFTAWNGDGRSALVLTHPERTTVEVEVEIKGLKSHLRTHRPFEPVELVQGPCTLAIPRNRLVVLEYDREQDGETNR
jgi:hypothetical protein